MYIRVTRGTHDPSKSEEIKQAIPDIRAVIRTLPGFQSFQAGTDSESGRTVAVTTFDTRENASFSRDKLGAPFERMKALGYTAEDPEIYEATQ